MPAAFVSAASSVPMDAARTSDGNVLIRLGFIFGLIFLMPAFVMQLAFDQVNFQFTSSRILQAVNLFCSFYGIILILTSRPSQDIVRQCRPAFMLIGLACLSTLWSLDPLSTLRMSFLLLTTTLFALAMASRLSPAVCIRTIMQAFALVCVLSIAWVVLFPNEAVHQATDRIQNVHAGLWRGIMSHKQGLGAVAGLAAGFFLFYGSTAFPSFIIRLGAIAAAIACVIGSGSATSLLTVATLTLMQYMTYWIALSPRQARKGTLYTLGGTLTVLYVAFHFGLLDFIMPMLGKSADLTGRADQWPWAIQMIRDHAPLLGGGYSSGWEDLWVPTISIDNGYIEMLGNFGYLGSAVLFSVYVWTLIQGIKMIRASSRETAHLDIFPFNIMFINFFLNVSEASFMTKSINTILICVAMCHIARFRTASRPRSANGRPPNTARRPGLGGLRTSDRRSGVRTAREATNMAG